MRLITTNHPRPRRIPDIWCHGFSRYLGRQLTPAEKIVISALEKSRTARPTPLLIIDSGHHDSRPILRAYQNYRLATSPQGATALLCTPDNPKRTGASHVCDTSPTGASKPSEAPPPHSCSCSTPTLPAHTHPSYATPATSAASAPPSTPSSTPPDSSSSTCGSTPGHPTAATQATSPASQSQRLPRPNHRNPSQSSPSPSLTASSPSCTHSLTTKKEKERILPLFSGTPCSAAQS